MSFETVNNNSNNNNQIFNYNSLLTRSNKAENCAIPFHIFRERIYFTLDQEEPTDLSELTLVEKVTEEWIKSAYTLYIADRLRSKQNVRMREVRLARHFNEGLFDRFLQTQIGNRN